MEERQLNFAEKPVQVLTLYEALQELINQG